MKSLNVFIDNCHARGESLTLEARISQHTGYFRARVCNTNSETVLDPAAQSYLSTVRAHDSLESAFRELDEILRLAEAKLELNERVAVS